MDPPYLYKLSQGTSLFRAKTIAKEGRGGKDDLLKYDISPDIWDAHNKLIKAHPFKPLWNPHTEDTIPSTGVSISSKKRNTRKNKKNSRIQTIL